MTDQPELRLDHLIVRTADVDGAVTRLREAGLPVLAAPEDVSAGMRSGIVRAGPVDLEVLAIGADAPPEPAGYGLGFVAPGQPLDEAARRLRGAGLATSAALTGRAEEGERRRTWRVVQVAGLLPEPFPVPVSLRPPGRLERVAGAALGLLGRIPAVARAATRRAGRSMVVVTDYGFDAAAWRGAVADGPAVTEVEIGVGDAIGAWKRLGRIAGPRLVLRPDGPSGVRRVVLSGDGWEAGRVLTLGAVRLEGAAS
jgi:hypothetical protein